MAASVLSSGATVTKCTERNVSLTLWAGSLRLGVTGWYLLRPLSLAFRLCLFPMPSQGHSVSLCPDLLIRTPSH
jgi:hypothetical protein